MTTEETVLMFVFLSATAEGDILDKQLITRIKKPKFIILKISDRKHKKSVAVRDVGKKS